MRYILPLLFGLAGCADIPALDGTLSDAARKAPYPVLVPLQNRPASPVADTDGFAARVAALQRRAAALRQTGPGALQ